MNSEAPSLDMVRPGIGSLLSPMPGHFPDCAVQTAAKFSNSQS